MGLLPKAKSVRDDRVSGWQSSEGRPPFEGGWYWSGATLDRANDHSSAVLNLL